MQIDLTLKDEDREIEYEVTVNARVVREIGGQPGHCCDVNSVQVNEVVCYFDKCGHEVGINPEFRNSLERYVERRFSDDIVQHCIEHFENAQAAA